MKAASGFLLVNKPAGPTSFDIIRKVRKVYSCKQVGHAGTLDPDAEGLLVCALGHATRLIELLKTDPKVYEFTVKFGEETDTLDASGIIIKQSDSIPLKRDIESVIPSLIGTQQQIPPEYSAIKINGKRAYDLARKGQTPKMKPRTIKIFSLAMNHYDSDNKCAQFRVRCSGGTYVRALARDIAEKVSTYAHTTEIRRMECGDFSLRNARLINDITGDEKSLMPISDALKHIPAVQATSGIIREVSHGRDVTLSFFKDFPERCLLFKGDEIIAMLDKVDNGSYHPSRVFMSSESSTE